MERYRGSASRYFLGTRAQVSAILGQELFELATVMPTGYALCERCPTFVLRRLDGK
jgi:hypothetical protein